MSYELSLLKGAGIEVQNAGIVYPLTLGEIDILGNDKYQSMLHYLLFDKTSIEDEEFIKVIETEGMSNFDVIFFLCTINKNFEQNFLDALEIAFKKKPSLHKDGFFYLGDIEDERIVHRDNFEEIKFIIRKQNMLDGSGEEKAKPLNKKAEEIKEKLMRMRKMVASKEKKKNGLTLDRIISIVASNSGTLNHTTIWDYTVYQLYDYFNQMMKRDGFEQQFQLLLQGADIKSSDLKHWAT